MSILRSYNGQIDRHGTRDIWAGLLALQARVADAIQLQFPVFATD